MNKFRKFLIGITVAAAAGCLCGAVACNTSDGDSGASSGVVDETPPEYFTLDLTGKGMDIVFEGDLAELDEKGESFRFGGKVKEGVDVRFKVLVGSNATGTPVVSLNNVLIQPDADGVYSFTMESNSTVGVTGLSAVHTLTLYKSEELKDDNGNPYRGEDRRIKFLGEDGKELGEKVRVISGESLKFKLWISPYYKDSYTVRYGSSLLEEDEDGYYVVSEVTDDGEIDLLNLDLQESFANVEDFRFGDGSEEHPFELSRPIDMYYFAVMVNDDFYNGNYASMHYKLTADIDMQGEQLYVIGDHSTEISAFSGTFDGNGHKISNFYITDEVYDQSSYTREYLPNVGLFGYAVATVDSGNNIIPAVIKNLTLENYNIQVHPATAGEGTFVGSVLGWGIGAEIINCKAVTGDDGFITVVNDNNQIINAGGLVGRLQAAYAETRMGTVSHSASVSSSSADVFLEGTGSPHSMGGLVGNLVSADESAIAYVVNSYSHGSVNGGMHTGGIVGTLSRFSSVANCYSTAQISANNSLEGLILEDFRGAYAGGIAGYAEDNTVIAGCYAANYTSASVNKLSAASRFGADFMSTGAFAGQYAKPASSEQKLADYVALTEYGNQTAVESPTEATFTALGWTAGEWTFAEGKLPEINAAAAARTVTVKIMNGATQEKSVSVAGYMPLSDWYKQSGGLPEYATNAQGHRSWGYYFDAELTKKVPCGFVPNQDEIQLYVGYADYTEIAGTYYVEETAYSNGAYIKLNKDGTAEIRNGGLSFNCVYSYSGAAHGAEIIIYRSCLASLSYSEFETNGGYFAYGGKAEGGALDLSAYITIMTTSGSSQQVSYTNEYATLRATKASADFVYGEYKDAGGVFYLFRNNGTGVMTGRTTSSAFTFTPSGDSFVITFAIAGNEITARQATVTLNGDGTVDTVNGVPVSAIDGFKGSWKKSANSAVEFTFDGEGGVTLNGVEAQNFKYENNSEVGFEIGNVKYKATLSNGALVINGETYYVSDGFTGDWFMVTEKEQFKIELGGIGTDGYGSAVITYSGGDSLTLEAEYDVFSVQDGRHLRIYVGDTQYGDLVYNGESNTATGSFYSRLYGEYRSYEFNIYDVFLGLWTGDGDSLDTVTFNGRSATAESAEVSIRTAGGVTRRGTYALTDAQHGTMTVGGKTYNIVYNEAENRVSVEEIEAEQPVSGQLGRRDGWYGVTLYDGDVSYYFDGKSEVGGSVVVTDGNDVGKLAYTVEGGAVKVDGKALTATATGFEWNNKTLVFRTGFADSWLIADTDAPLVIGEVGGHLNVEIGGKQFVYDPAENTLTHTDGEDITLITLLGDDAMSIAYIYGDGGYEDVKCVRSAKADAYRGTYTAEDGSGWKFDGLGGSKYTSGTATYTPVTGDPVKYSYNIDALGNPYISAESGLSVLQVADGKYSGKGKSFNTVEVDMYYGRTVYIIYNDSRDGKDYFFDGVSGVWVKDSDATEYTQKAYTYEIVTSVLCEIIDNDGVRYNGEMSRVGAVIEFKVTDQLEAVKDGVTYAFGVSTVWIKDGSGYTKAYDKSVDIKEADEEHSNMISELTDANGDKFLATLVYNEETETYEMTVQLKISFEATVGEGEDAKTYAFGEEAETLWLKGEDGYTKAYIYEVISEDDRIYRLTGLNGDKFIAQVTMSEDGKTYVMTIKSLTEVTVVAGEDVLTYVFGEGNDTVWLKKYHGNYTKAYTYKAIGEDGRTYELTDLNGKKFTAQVTYNGETGANEMTVTPVEEETEEGTDGQA